MAEPEPKVSYNWIRELLEQGYNQFMRMIPEGEEAVLNVQYAWREEIRDVRNEHTPLGFLRLFTAACTQLVDRENPDFDKVRRILEERGGAQLLILGAEDEFFQRFAD